jgi:hypothetical protein
MAKCVRFGFIVGSDGRGEEDGELEFEEWLSVVVRVLRDFPEARRAIEAALAAVGDGGVES